MLSGTGGMASPGYLLPSFVTVCLWQQECWVASACSYLNVLSPGWSVGGKLHLLGSPHMWRSWSAQCQVGEPQRCPARPIAAETSAQQRLVPTYGEEPRGTVAAPITLGREVSPSPRLSQCSPRWGTCGDAGAEHLGTVPDLAGEEAKQQKRDQHGLGSTFYNHNNFCCCCFPMCKSKDFSAKKVLLGSLLILQ